MNYTNKLSYISSSKENLSKKNVSSKKRKNLKLIKSINTKIFNNNLNKNSRTVNLKSKIGAVGNMRYLPSFSKE
jgi:hypothetical protein